MSDSKVTLRPLGLDDLDRVVTLDRGITDISRRGFFDKRLRAQERNPDAFVSMGAFSGDDLVGITLAYLLDGEFGATATVAVLDAVAVAPEHRSAGIGQQLMEAVCEQARAQGAVEMQTQVGWDETGMYGYFAAAGFELAPRLVLERDTVADAF
ncbi:MAG: GNAT family N-acetyltransferase [Gammaproteobacteria bacterium]|nr:GNAT family N-acetyltransferase [Gammaproteobacteria bacterium]